MRAVLEGRCINDCKPAIGPAYGDDHGFWCARCNGEAVKAEGKGEREG